MKVLKVSAIMGGKNFTKLFSEPVGRFERDSLGHDRYITAAFPKIIAIVNLNSISDTAASIKMLGTARMGNNLLVPHDSVEVETSKPVIIVIGNVDFTFEIVDVG